MSPTVKIAPVHRTFHVDLPQAQAFDLFSKGIDRWWPRTHHIGSAPLKEAIIEPFSGGRWYHSCEDGSESTVGRVLTWEPPGQLMLTWELNSDFQRDPKAATEVEVRFIAESAARTRIEFEHRNLERIGDRAEEVRAMLDGGWVSALDNYVKEANAAH